MNTKGSVNWNPGSNGTVFGRFILFAAILMLLILRLMLIFINFCCYKKINLKHYRN